MCTSKYFIFGEKLRNNSVSGVVIVSCATEYLSSPQCLMMSQIVPSSMWQLSCSAFPAVSHEMSWINPTCGVVVVVRSQGGDNIRAKPNEQQSKGALSPGWIRHGTSDKSMLHMRTKPNEQQSKAPSLSWLDQKRSIRESMLRRKTTAAGYIHRHQADHITTTNTATATATARGRR